MHVVLAAPSAAAVPLARNGYLDLYGKGSCRSTHRGSAATVCSAAASSPINRPDRPAATRTPRPRHSNPDSDRGTAARSPSAVSSPGGFRTPALGAHAPSRIGPASETLHNTGRDGHVAAERRLAQHRGNPLAVSHTDLSDRLRLTATPGQRCHHQSFSRPPRASVAACCRAIRWTSGSA